MFFHVKELQYQVEPERPDRSTPGGSKNCSAASSAK